jgi:hypothetical protein
MRAAVNASLRRPGFIGNFAEAMGSIRAISAFACAIVTPGLSLATPPQQKPIRRTLPRFSRIGASNEILRSMN